MSMIDLTEEFEKMQPLLASLLDESKKIEKPILEWLTRIIGTDPIASFVHLAENPKYLSKLSGLTQLSLWASNQSYSKFPNIVNYVNMLSSIWKDKKQTAIFAPFSRFLHGKLNPSFDFETDFEALLYSHTYQIVYIIVIVSVLTIIMVHQNEEDNASLAIFSKIEETSPEVREQLKAEFKTMVALFDEISSCLANRFEKDVIRGAGLEADNIGRLSAISDMQIFRRIEDQEKTIENMQTRILALDAEKTKLAEGLEAATKASQEKDKEIQQLRFSRDDLVEKLKNKRLEFVSDALLDKEAEIKGLRDRLQQAESSHQARMRNLEDERENLHKKIHQLQNYKSEFESIQLAAERQNQDARKETQVRFSEEVQSLKEKIVKLQEASLGDKERCLDLEMRLSKQEMEVHALKMDKQDLEYKVRELEGHNEAMSRSEVYTENLEEIAKEMSSGSETAKLQLMLGHYSMGSSELEGQARKISDETFTKKAEQGPNSDRLAALQREISVSFANYERRCLHRIKTVLKELREQKDRGTQMLKEIEHLRLEVDELTEKSNQLESGLAERLVEKSPQVQELLRQFGGGGREGSEIAQDLLKTVLKREQEIVRLKANRKRMSNELLNAEAKCIEMIDVVYTATEAFYSS